MGPDRIWPAGGWNDECFRVVNDKRLEGLRRAFYDGFFALHQVQYVYAAICVMRGNAGEPVASRFDELALVEPGSFFSPSPSAGDD